MGDEVDLMEHLNQQRQKMAAMQEAANMAQEQAMALMHLQRRVAEIDALANGTGGPPADSKSSSAEVGMRALEAGFLHGANKPAASGSSHKQTAPNPRTSLSAEDRRRFGLDDSAAGPAATRDTVESMPSQSLGTEYSRMNPISNEIGSGSSPGARNPMTAGSRVGGSRGVRPIGAVASALQERNEEAYLSSHPSRGVGGPPRVDAQGPMSNILSDSVGSNLETSPQPESSRPWRSSLSVEDRRRFGLDAGGGETLPSRARTPPSQYREPKPMAGYPSAQAQSAFHHPDVLWGRDGGSAADTGMNPSMAKTLAQLEAVGATKLVADLRESERRLQSLKMSG